MLVKQEIVFGWPFVKQFALCYQTIVCFVCLSSRPVCNIGVLWPNGWMDQDEIWHAGRPLPWPRCVSAHVNRGHGHCGHGRPSQLLLRFCNSRWMVSVNCLLSDGEWQRVTPGSIVWSTWCGEAAAWTRWDCHVHIVCTSGARLTKSLRTGPVSHISSSQVRHKFGPEFDLRQI